ncbi:MAG: type II toxin-antitoxin system HicB family antitoxin [Thermosynechococcaceae cyanobacterium MS004]|nr:type II toxin-antitoxin system HicB family antitoxin [Thermosynechococcaceae cyanobacterium MS004]
MKDMMEYKGYFGSVHYSDEDELFYGKAEFIRSLISYEGHDVSSLKTSFHEAVEDYLELCQQRGTEPEKAFKGSFNVRTGSDLHRRATLSAQQQGMNLNRLVTEALEQYLQQSSTPSRQ